MRKLLTILFLGILLLSEAQILQPAKWSYSSDVTSVGAGETIELVFKVQIEPNWYVYSTEFNCEDGPIKTSFKFTPHSSFEIGRAHV